MILHTSCRAPLQSPGCEQFSVIIHGGIFHLSKSHCILLEVLLRTKMYFVCSDILWQGAQAQPCEPLGLLHKSAQSTCDRIYIASCQVLERWPTSWSLRVTSSSAATVFGDRLESSAMSRCNCSSLLCASTLRERA